MLYTKTVLCRATGDEVEINAGNWVTVTELGSAYGAGPRRVRSVLHHMGLLRPEGHHGRYRLSPEAVERGLGKRIDKAKSGWPFDVISPLGQQLIAQAWADTVQDLDDDLRSDLPLAAAKRGLEEFFKLRAREMTTQKSVCWLRDHFKDLSFVQIAKILEVDERLVARYANLQTSQRDFQRRQVRAWRGRQASQTESVTLAA